MPARLMVSSESGEPAEFDITEDVMRIGSGAQCEVCLRSSGLDPHAATLEYREGDYVLHNRSPDPLHLGRRTLQLRDSAVWQPGETADFGNGCIVELQVEADPTPSKPAPKVAIEYDKEDPESEDAAKAKPATGSTKKTLNFLVIVAAVPLIGLMLANEPGTEAPTAKKVRFDDLITKLASNPEDQARGPQSLRLGLQRARSAELRGDKKEARKAYGSVRDALLSHRLPDGKFKNAEDELAWSYVIGRMGALQTSGPASELTK